MMNGRSQYTLMLARDTEGIALLACGGVEVYGEVVIQRMVKTKQ